jgi:hypothetical protein
MGDVRAEIVLINIEQKPLMFFRNVCRIIGANSARKTSERKKFEFMHGLHERPPRHIYGVFWYQKRQYRAYLRPYFQPLSKYISTLSWSDPISSFRYFRQFRHFGHFRRFRHFRHFYSLFYSFLRSCPCVRLSTHQKEVILS